MRLCFPIFVLGLTSCATTNAGLSATSPQPTILGSVNGVSYTLEDLSADARARLADQDNEAQQERLHSLWSGFEERVDAHLLEAEAKRKGLSVAEFKKSHIDAALIQPTDAEVEQAYEENAEHISVPKDVALPFLRQEMLNDRRQTLESEILGKLRQGVDVRYGLSLGNPQRLRIDVGDAPASGAANAAVTVVEFSDFQCPYCARARDTLHTLRETYGDKLRIVFRDYPLPQHPEAKAAAEAAQCAHEQGKFWPYHDRLFDNPSELGANALVRYAEETKLDLSAFQSCLASERPKEAVARHMLAGETLGVSGTPALFINGIKLIGLLPLPLMRIIIDEELQKGSGRT